MKYTVTTEMTDADICASLEHWLSAWVIGENLCPFAASAWLSGAVTIDVLRGPLDAQMTHLAQAFETLASGTDPEANCLVALAEGAEDFDDFLDVLDMAEQLLVALGYEGILQIASFHPAYRFADSGAVAGQSHLTDFTNRAPFPCLHLLQEAAVAAAIDRHPDPAGIPERNQAHLVALGDTVVYQRWSLAVGSADSI